MNTTLKIFVNDPNGNEIAKSFSNANPDASNVVLKTTAQKLNSLTDNTLKRVERINVTDITNDEEEIPETETITLTATPTTITFTDTSTVHTITYNVLDANLRYGTMSSQPNFASKIGSGTYNNSTGKGTLPIQLNANRVPANGTYYYDFCYKSGENKTNTVRINVIVDI